jgi:hypothetical protein
MMKQELDTMRIDFYRTKGINELYDEKSASHYWQDNFIFTINQMNSLLYIIAVILVIAWLIGMIGFHAGGIIHILLVLAIISVLLRLIRGRSV